MPSSPPRRKVLATIFVTFAAATIGAASQNNNPSTIEPTTFVIDAAKNSSPSTTTTAAPKTTSTMINEDTSELYFICPNITGAGLECSCELAHTLRCTGDEPGSALEAIRSHLRRSRPGDGSADRISLLDLTLSGMSVLPSGFLEGVELQGLVVSTGELKRIHEAAFASFARNLRALGLPNNRLDNVPTAALARLTVLERLDLSHNQLKTIEASSFRGMGSLTYLDVSYNHVSQLSPQAFGSLPKLKSLKMRGNRLTSSALSALRGLRNLEELDVSANLLSGPLGPSLLPPMPKLRYLSVAENDFKNVQQGALMGLKNLSSLSLSHNHIDVLEDHAFRYMATLTRLELAYNDIVAVSSASLAHLDKLLSLDLSHNFLRSLSADLVVPLRSLEELRLDDNDITMISSDLPTSKLRLRSLSLADNPLQCDCSLADFSAWLASSQLSDDDKRSAVCATPPALENGLLAQVPPGSLICGESTSSAVNARRPNALANSGRLTLAEFHYDEATGVDMLWRVEPCSERYTCDTLTVYEATKIGSGETNDDEEDDDENETNENEKENEDEYDEIEVASSPIHCDSRLMREPCTLPVSLPATPALQSGKRYRYCVVLMLPSGYDELHSGHGCSDLIELTDSVHLDFTADETESAKHIGGIEQQLQLQHQRISAVHVNFSTDGYLKVEVTLSGPPHRPDDCAIELDVFAAQSGQVHRKRLNCSSVESTTLPGLLPGRYRVCARLDDGNDEDENNKDKRDAHRRGRARCVDVQTLKQTQQQQQQQKQQQNGGTPYYVPLVAVFGLFGLGVVAIATSCLLGCRARKQAECNFMPTGHQQLEISHKAHYIKLLATTKV